MKTTALDYSRYSRLPNKALQHIPGDTGIPILGDTLPFLNDLRGLTTRKHNRYGPLFRAYAFFQHTVVALGPEANATVLNTSAADYSNKLAWDPTLDRLFPNGLMLMDFDNHRYNRKLLQSAFKRQAIERYLTDMAAHIESGLGNWPVSDGLPFYPHVKALLLDIAAEVFLGIEIGEQADQLNHAFIAAMEASTSVIKLPFVGRRWQRGLNGRKLLEQFMLQHLPAKRASHDGDFFAHICHAEDEQGQLFADQAIVDHLIFLLFAAHDTTTSTLCSITYCLAKNPKWQERVREECLGLGKDNIGFEDMVKLEQTGLVIKEALRIYPPLPVIPRRCVRETQLLDYTVPRNASVALSPLFTHYSEEHWSDPERFDPERFSKQRAEDKGHFFQYIPFGGGAHKCLGLNFAELQSKLFLFHFLRRFQVSVPTDYKMQYSPIPLSLPTDGLPVSVTKIS